MNNILELPEDCLSQILSLTSPKDVLRSSVVSKQFLSASVSDIVWNKFLPSDCDEILSRSSSSIPYERIGSKKDLFNYLAHFPILLDNNTKSFALDKWSGKISYMLGVKALTIICETSPQYTSWVYVLKSRFPERAVLNDVNWLEIKGKIHTTLLSPGTTYGAFFVYLIQGSGLTNGYAYAPVKVSVSELVVVEDGLSSEYQHAPQIKSIYLKPPEYEEYAWVGQTFPEERPVIRDDGWNEIEMGRYEVGIGGKGEGVMLEMTLKEVETLHWKFGLVVHGIELRPLS